MLNLSLKTKGDIGRGMNSANPIGLKNRGEPNCATKLGIVMEISTLVKINAVNRDNLILSMNGFDWLSLSAIQQIRLQLLGN